MLHALIHGKLESHLPEPHRLEDALTSSVFGTLIIVEAWDSLARWLTGTPAIRPAADRCECWFWPRMAHGVEPDVVLRIGDVLVIVEAKYRSSRHDLASVDEDPTTPVDQLVRQHRAASPPHDSRPQYAPSLERAVRECSLIQAFVVDGRRMRTAQREYAESRARLPADSNLRLVTWQQLHALLAAHSSAGPRWRKDILAYLALCGLASFQGVRRNLPAASQVLSVRHWAPLKSGLDRTLPHFPFALRGGAQVVSKLRGWHAIGSE